MKFYLSLPNNENCPGQGVFVIDVQFNTVSIKRD